MPAPRFQAVRSGRLLDIAGHRSDYSDILIEGNVIREIGAAGMAAPEDAREVDAAQRLIMPGLINSHTHGHGALAKGMGDRWTLELLLNAGPWTKGSRIHSDKYLAVQLNAADMITKGCTACYDLSFELPLPTTEGMESVAQAYADTGIRAVVAPMMADKLFFEASSLPATAEIIDRRYSDWRLLN
ncbi:MAG: amidohydrolase family protein [Pseudomonadota bacterium]|nr:amidohydrolase family protein [Pseudomonadota bacterium]